MSNEELLRYCPNYRYIMEYVNKEDEVTDKIISLYKSYVMKAPRDTRSQIRRIKDFDYIMFVYLDDYLFHDQLNKKFPYLEFMVSNNVVDSLVDEIFKTYNSYAIYLNRRIKNSKYVSNSVSYKY